MQKEDLFEKVTLLKDKFKNFFQHRKKVAALENYAQAEPVSYKEELKLIKVVLKNRFLSQKGAEFIEELLDEHQVNHLDWAHRTKWLKKEISERRRKTKEVQSTFFDLEAEDLPLNVPLEVMIPTANQYQPRV